MKPTSDPRWNREYVAQRLRDRKADDEMRRIAAKPVAVQNDADYWFGEYLEATRHCTELETENEKLRFTIRALLLNRPVSRSVHVEEVW